jgi:hypothetical protein
VPLLALRVVISVTLSNCCVYFLPKWSFITVVYIVPGAMSRKPRKLENILCLGSLYSIANVAGHEPDIGMDEVGWAMLFSLRRRRRLWLLQRRP